MRFSASWAPSWGSCKSLTRLSRSLRRTWRAFATKPRQLCRGRCIRRDGASERAPRRPCLISSKAGPPLLDECALCFGSVTRGAQRTTELFLAAISIFQGEGKELANALPRRANGQRGIGGNRVGQPQRRGKQLIPRHHAIDEPDLERTLGGDRLGREKELEGVDPRNLPREKNRRVAGGIESKSDLFKCEG